MAFIWQPHWHHTQEDLWQFLVIDEISALHQGMFPDSKVHGSIWGQQDPGVPHVGPMNFAIWVIYLCIQKLPQSPNVAECMISLHDYE